MDISESGKFIYRREFWSGDSRDGKNQNGEGYHYFKMTEDGLIVEAIEIYDAEDGEEVVSNVPEMNKVHWIKDLGFKDFDTLDDLEKNEFERAREILTKS